VCHRTVSGAPGRTTLNSSASSFLRRRSAIMYRTVRCATRLSGAPAEQRLDSATVACNATVRRQFAQKSEQPPEAHRTVHSTCPVRHRIVRCHKKTKLQRSNPNGWVTWLAHRTVRCAHRQQPAPTVELVIEGYKYPPTTSTPTIQAFTTVHSIQERYTSLQRHKSSYRSAQSLKFNSNALGLVT
jgi:hypothetical protein